MHHWVFQLLWVFQLQNLKARLPTALRLGSCAGLAVVPAFFLAESRSRLGWVILEWDGAHAYLEPISCINVLVAYSMSLFLTLPSLRARECVLAREYPPVRVEGRGECWWTILSNWILDQWLECWSPYCRSGACSHSGDKMSRAKE